MKRTLLCGSLLGVLSLSQVGCGAASFEPSFTKPVAPTEINVGKQIVRAKARTERAVAVGITSNPSKLCAWDMNAGGLLWEQAVEAKSTPLVVGDAIVLQEQDGIVVRDLGTGAIRVVLDDEGHLIGADGIGSELVVTIAYDGEETRSEVTFIQGSRVRWRQALNLAVGVPALLGDRVLVPWASQRLSVLASNDGMELARWSFTNMIVGHAVVDRERVFVGEHGLVRVKEDLADYRDGPIALYAPVKRSLPGQPALLRNGSKPVPAPDSAANKLALDWRIGLENEGQSTENDLLVLRYYRVLFGLAASADEVKWLRIFDHDVIGTSIEPGGTWVADAAGNLSFLDASGATRFSRSLGKTLRSVTLRSSGFVPGTLSDAAPQPSIHDQLLAAAQLADTRISPARSYAIDRLATLPDANVTAELLALCSDAESPEPVSRTACTRLSTRENGGPEVLTALRTKGSFLKGVAAPPVGALAQAASKMSLQPAAPLLVTQAEDPNTSAADLVAVFQALGALDHRPAASTLERFVRLHHAEPQGSDLGPALHAALTALGDLRAQSARATLEDVAADVLSSEPVRNRAREVLGVIDSPIAPAPKPAPAPEKAKAVVAEPEPKAAQVDARPYALSPEAVQATLAPLRKTLLGCLSSDPGKGKQARISLVITGEGSVEKTIVTPSALGACMEPVLRTAKFPATRLGRQRITHNLEGESPKAAAEKPAAAPVAPPAKPTGKAAAAPVAPAAKPVAKPAATQPAAAAKPKVSTP